jgi:CRP/FNR family cyclic AMP-dependent transcriptional regulator
VRLAKVGQTVWVQPSEIGSVLSGSSLFLSLDREALAAVAASCTQRRFARGQYLFHQGDVGDQLYIVASGLVKVVFGVENGDELVLATLGPGQVLGELAVLDRVPRSASAVAVRACSVLMLDRAVLLALMRSHPSAMDAMMVLLGGLVRRLTEHAGDLAFLDIAGRLAKLLLRLTEAAETQAAGSGSEPGHGSGSAHGSGSSLGAAGDEQDVVLNLSLSQTELAAMIGASRPAVNRALHAMADRGLIQVTPKTIVVRDRQALRRRATR